MHFKVSNDRIFGHATPAVEALTDEGLSLLAKINKSSKEQYGEGFDHLHDGVMAVATHPMPEKLEDAPERLLCIPLVAREVPVAEDYAEALKAATGFAVVDGKELRTAVILTHTKV